jgi:2',3'-cyclic-nucleotide 2'-phosphodiesterase (5'-nucleotidase family)
MLLLKNQNFCILTHPLYISSINILLIMTSLFTRLFVLGAVALTVLVSSPIACSQTTHVTILHTNDLHASFLPHEAVWIRSDPKPMVGGFQELSWMIDSIRTAKKGSDVMLLLDGGDVMTGTPISEFDYNGSAGGALFEMMNKIGYDAWTPGNHDFDISQENLHQHTQMVKFPTVNANIVDSTGNLIFEDKEYVILKKGNLRIGVIGLMTRELFNVTNTKNLQGLKVLQPVDITQKIIDKITPMTDLIVALTHEGVDDDSLLAVSTHGLNVIIGGHSHTRLKTPKIVNNVIICQTGANCENLGELELVVENKKVTHFDGKLLSLWVHGSYPENELNSFIKENKQKIDAAYGEVIGTLATDWKRGGKGENNIGNFLADAMREAGKSDFAVTNSSGIRKDLSAGPIKKLDIFEIVPFRNVLCTFTISGKDVKVFAQRYAQSIIDGTTSTQLSGLACSWKRENGKAVIVQAKLGGKDVVDEGQYSCATSDFVINQGDKYLWMQPQNVTYLTTTVFQVLADKVKKEKTVNSQIEHRFQEIQ